MNRRPHERDTTSAGEEQSGDPPQAFESDYHLQSMNDTRKFRVQTGEGEDGHVDDFLCDDIEWVIRYIVVDTRNFIPGRKVLIATGWVERIDWESGHFHLSVPLQKLRNAPAYDSSTNIDRDYEQMLHAHFDKRPYWE
jgi:hypothetical protein